MPAQVRVRRSPRPPAAAAVPAPSARLTVPGGRAAVVYRRRLGRVVIAAGAVTTFLLVGAVVTLRALKTSGGDPKPAAVSAAVETGPPLDPEDQAWKIAQAQ